MTNNASSLTKRLLKITLGVIASLCIFFLSSNYILTTQALDREINRSLEYRANLTQLALEDRLNTTSETLQALSQQNDNKQQFNTSRLLKQLDNFTLSQEGRYIDIMAVVHSNGTIQHNLSSPLIENSHKLITNFHQTHAPNGWHLAVVEIEAEKHVAIMRETALLDPNFGKVVGNLVYGIFLNDSAPLVNDLKNKAKIEGVQLYLNNTLLSSSGLMHENAKTLNLSTSLGYQSGEDSLFINILVNNQLRRDIDQAYIANAIILLTFSLIAVFIMIALIHRVTSTSFSKLMSYAGEIEATQASLPYKPGNISEFNLLGSTLENLVHSLEDSRASLNQREEHIRQIINSTAEAIYGLDLKGICTFANNACIEKLGYQNQADLVGTRMHNLMHYKHADGSPYPASECPVSQSLISGEHVHSEQEVLWKADGSCFPAEYWSHPILEGDRIAGAVITFFDITQKTQAEESLRRAQKMDAVGQLTGGIAHDFNNILGIILGNVKLLKRNLETDDERSRLDVVEKSATRAADLTKQLLGFSRSKTTEAEVTNVNRVVNEMKNLISRSLTPEVDIQFSLTEQKVHALINPGDLGDAILNLVINSRDAMPEGGQLIIETSYCELDDLYCSTNSDLKPGFYVQIAVSDTGSGISPADQKRIFEPFFTTKPLGKGTGLGLAMVFGFAKRSCGHVQAYSELGIGTTFRLYLPCAEGEEEIKSPQDNKHLPRGTESILVVDDEPELLNLAQFYLKDLGYDVICANNGTEALEKIKKHPETDLLFSDVVMPGGVNGYQLAEKALVLKPTLKILLTSGYTGRIIRNTDQEIFEAQLITKPYTFNELAIQVRAILGNTKSTEIEPEDNEKLAASKLGIKSYDKEHAQVMAFYEQSKHMEDGYTESALAELLNQITNYASEHLPLEEAIMEACKYPGLGNHKQVHNLLLKQLELIKSLFKTGTLRPDTLSTFLTDWWIDHILTMDSAAIDHCKQQPDTIKRVVNSFQSGPI